MAPEVKHQPDSDFEKLFSPSKPNTSLGANNIIIVSDDRRHSDVQSLADYHEKEKLPKERRKLDELRGKMFSHDENINVPRTESADYIEAMQALESQRERVKVLESHFVPHKIEFAAELKVDQKTHHKLQQHAAVVREINGRGELASVGIHAATNSCGNYVAKLLEPTGVIVPPDESSEQLAASERPLDAAGLELVNALSERGAEFKEPKEARRDYAQIYEQRGQAQPNLTENITAERALEIGNASISHDTLYAVREGGTRASYYGQYVRAHEPQSESHSSASWRPKSGSRFSDKWGTR